MYCSTHSYYIPPPHSRNSIQESSSGARLECNIVISKTQFILLPFHTTEKYWTVILHAVAVPLKRMWEFSGKFTQVWSGEIWNTWAQDEERNTNVAEVNN